MLRISKRRFAKLQEDVYRALRDYQDEQSRGSKETSGVRAGRLDYGLTRVLDRVTEAVKRAGQPLQLSHVHPNVETGGYDFVDPLQEAASIEPRSSKRGNGLPGARAHQAQA